MQSKKSLSPAAPTAFTLDAYRAGLTETITDRTPRGFEILEEPALPSKPFCLVRHDIDVSPTRALAVARIEAELGVRATYTVLLSSRFYNAFESKVRDALREIAALGHDIGLHFDAAWHGIADECALADALEREAQVLARLLNGPPIRMFAFHDPNTFAMSCRKPSHGGAA